MSDFSLFCTVYFIIWDNGSRHPVFQCVLQIPINKKLYSFLIQNRKVVGFMSDVGREMCYTGQHWFNSWLWLDCRIGLTNRRQKFDCQEIGRFLGTKNLMYARNYRRIREIKRKERIDKHIIIIIIRGKNYCYLCLLCTNILQKNARPTAKCKRYDVPQWHWCVEFGLHLHNTHRSLQPQFLLTEVMRI